VELAPQPGTLLADRYRLLRPLARGGMGSVWKAEHLALGSEVAVKIIDPRIASRDMGVPRFLREARALAALRSPYIVQVIDFGSDGDIVYLVMELLEGRTLGQRLKTEGKLSPAETNRILAQVCRAMSHAHERGIVHRDLKPDNVFLCDQSREHVTKVVDFGIAKPMGGVAASVTGTEAGVFLGTPSYMSPEQCIGSKGMDHRSDLWALGAIAYECLVGKRLFDGDVIGELVVRICTEALPVSSTSSQLPAGFDVWLNKAMARSPADRFQSATELALALGAVLASVDESQPGVDSARTLHDERAPTPSASAAGVSSTLENGSLAQPSGQPRRGERTSFKLVIASVVAIALAAVIALVRMGVSTRGSHADALGQTNHAPPPGAHIAPAISDARPAPSSVVSSTGEGSGGELNEAGADGGVVIDAKRQSVRQTALVNPSPREAPRSAPRQPSKRVTPQRDAADMEILRKKR
jgi:eukaryotic-like serine/threonine-protein kinase